MMNDTFYKLRLNYSFTAFPSQKDEEIFIQWPSGIIAVNTEKFAAWLMKKPSRATMIAMLQRKKEKENQ